MPRPTWDEYFMTLAWQVATRSTCLRRAVGAALVLNKRLLATGYNGAPHGLRHCEEIGCMREKLKVPSGERHELCRALHAEQNALLQAAAYGVPVIGATLYCTTQPCALCAKMLINARIEKIFVSESYPDEFALSLLSEAKVPLMVMQGKNGGAKTAATE